MAQGVLVLEAGGGFPVESDSLSEPFVMRLEVTYEGILAGGHALHGAFDVAGRNVVPQGGQFPVVGVDRRSGTVEPGIDLYGFFTFAKQTPGRGVPKGERSVELETEFR